MATAPERETSLDDGDDKAAVSAHQSSPDRTVFTEEGNSDAWIATDLTVDLDR